MTSMVAVFVNQYIDDIISLIEIFNKFKTFTINKTIVSSLQYGKIFDKMLLTFFFSVQNVSRFTHCEISAKQNTWPLFGS